MQDESPKSGRASSCLVRLFWMGVGNLVLVLSAVGIGQNRAGFRLSGLDAIFWGTVFGLLAVRYVDIRWLSGQTVDSRPASMSDWRRYSLTILGVSLAMWVVAHAIP